MERYNFFRGYRCPRCDGDTDIFRDERSETVGWVCTDDCTAVGFGFQSRRLARIGLREYRDQFDDSPGDFR